MVLQPGIQHPDPMGFQVSHILSHRCKAHLTFRGKSPLFHTLFSTDHSHTCIFSASLQCKGYMADITKSILQGAFQQICVCHPMKQTIGSQFRIQRFFLKKNSLTAMIHRKQAAGQFLIGKAVLGID